MRMEYRGAMERMTDEGAAGKKRKHKMRHELSETDSPSLNVEL